MQDFIPLKSIRNGIVETTDGRYLKILEIEPINFLLRSSEEQYEIISSFASWLKIAPMRLQFKSITRKADSDQYIAGLQSDLETETSEACCELARSAIRFIREEGSREALTRRFFLIFQYEAASGHYQMNVDYSEIYAALQTAAQNARTYFSQCGNNIVQPKDEDAFLAELIYMFFNRRSCVDDSFLDRLDRIVVDAMLAKKRTIGVDPLPNIRDVNFVAPRGIDLTHSNYVIMDGSYYTYLYIRKGGYPTTVRGGWMSALINAGEGIDVDLFLQREIRGKTIDRVAQRIRLNRTKLRERRIPPPTMRSWPVPFRQATTSSMACPATMKTSFICPCSSRCQLPATGNCSGASSRSQTCSSPWTFRCAAASSSRKRLCAPPMPFLRLASDLERKAKRNVLTSGAASSYMFTSFELSDDNGILLGLNRHNNSLCIVDPFNTKRYKNANFMICGTSGSGKTVTIQTMALRLRMRGTQCFIIAPLKGHEFKRACHKMGGTYIKLSPAPATVSMSWRSVPPSHLRWN